MTKNGSANCPTCGVSYGNHPAEQLRKAGADYVINDFAQLLEIVKGDAV